MRRPIATVLLIVVITLSGCAASSENYHAPYISSSQFQTYNCEELLTEIERIQTRVNQLTDKANEKIPNNKDKWTLGTDLSLSWAALLALSGTKEQEAEFAQLKSEYDAIQYWAITKKCPGVIPPDHPPEFDPNLVKEFKPNETSNWQ